MIPAEYNLKNHYKGSTFAPIGIKFNFDITGATLICQIKKDENWQYIHQWKTGENITVIDLETGHISLNQILNFDAPAGNYVFDFQINYANGTSQTYIKGNLKIVQDITRL